MNAPETIAPPPNASAVALLPIAEIVHSLSNHRRHFNGEYLAELAESIKSLVSTNFTIRAFDLFGQLATGRDRKRQNLPRQRGRNGAGIGWAWGGFHGVRFYLPGDDLGAHGGPKAGPWRIRPQPQRLDPMPQQRRGHFIAASMYR